jgi:MFS family permease
LSDPPRPQPADEAPPGIESPGMRERVARLAIDVSPLRVSPAFRRFWAGQAVKDLGGQMVLVALPIQVYQLTGSTLAVGLLGFVELVPLLTLTLVGGALADAMDRRRLMLWTQFGMAVGGVFLVINAALPQPRVWACFVLGFLTASFFCLGIGGMRSVVARLVPEDKIAAASVLESISGSFSSVAGPALAGLSIKFLGLPWTYAFDLFAFAIGIASIWSLPKIEPLDSADRPSLSSILDGFRYVLTQPVVLGFMLVDLNAMIFGMPMALFPALATHRYGDPSLAGYLYSAPYAGALVASLGSGWIPHVRRQGLAVVIAAAAWGAVIAAFGFSETFWVGLLLLALAGAADDVSAIFRSTMMLTATPEAMRGRLTGIEFAQVASGPTLGNTESAVVASFTSLRFSIVSGGLLCVAGTIGCALAFPALVRYDARKKLE